MTKQNMSKLVLQSGFSFDYSHMLGEGRLQTADLTALLPQMKAAALAVKEMSKTGLKAGHLSKDGTPEPVYFPRLPYPQAGYPNSPESLSKLTAYGKKVRAEADAVIFCGIGGSYLGGKVLADCVQGQFWEKAGEKIPRIYFSGNSMDAEATEQLWQELQTLAKLAKTHGKRKFTVELIPISKSGTTLEPTSAFLFFYDRLTKAGDLFALQVAVVTDEHKVGPLNKLAQKYSWPLFDVPDGIGGRFSVLSNPGLVVAAVVGMDIEALLQGARDMDKSCQQAEPRENPALVNAALKYLADSKFGCAIEVLMPYAFNLKSLGEWYVQLLAESLGKRNNLAGEKVFYGRTPIVAIGSTDMHAQTQQHQDGRRNKVIQFLEIGGREKKVLLTNPFPEIEAFKKFEGMDLNSALLNALNANEEALNSDNRFSARYFLPKLNAYYLGQIFYFLMLSIAYEGELAGIDAYDQPGVEIYKKIMNKNL